MHQHRVICCVIDNVKLMYDGPQDLILSHLILQNQLINNSFHAYPIKIK